MGSALIEKFESVMMPVASKISGNKYLLAMRDSFSMLLPFIIVVHSLVLCNGLFWILGEHC